MGGSNPYMKTSPTVKASKPYKIRFLNLNKEILVDPNNMPSSATGLEGSILDIALASDIDIDHACGGVCACSTCHVIVKKGLESCNQTTEEEDDMLDQAPGLTPNSRLACQTVPNGTSDIEIEIPNWNRNLVREGK